MIKLCCSVPNLSLVYCDWRGHRWNVALGKGLWHQGRINISRVNNWNVGCKYQQIPCGVIWQVTFVRLPGGLWHFIWTTGTVREWKTKGKPLQYYTKSALTYGLLIYTAQRALTISGMQLPNIHPSYLPWDSPFKHSTFNVTASKKRGWLKVKSPGVGERERDR